jgi:hypothetical protein
MPARCPGPTVGIIYGISIPPRCPGTAARPSVSVCVQHSLCNEVTGFRRQEMILAGCPPPARWVSHPAKK